MLTAEENILLPLTLAGDKPDPEFFEHADRQRRPRRPPQAPPVGAVRRPAAARRDRARARLRADGRLRRRADRQPRLEDGRRDPRPARTSVTEYGQTPVMVTHDAACCVDRRPHPLPRRRRDRQGRGPHASRPTSALRWTSSRGDPGRAFSGLLGRKLRAALTAIAIVLGVAMISGTYVLTDTIDQAFDTIFSESVPRHERRRSRQDGLRTHQRGDTGSCRRRCRSATSSSTRRSTASPQRRRMSPERRRSSRRTGRY